VRRQLPLAAVPFRSPGADVGESRRRCGRVPAQMWASPRADVGESPRRCARPRSARTVKFAPGSSAAVRRPHDSHQGSPTVCLSIEPRRFQMIPQECLAYPRLPSQVLRRLRRVPQESQRHAVRRLTRRPTRRPRGNASRAAHAETPHAPPTRRPRRNASRAAHAETPHAPPTRKRLRKRVQTRAHVLQAVHARVGVHDVRDRLALRRRARRDRSVRYLARSLLTPLNNLILVPLMISVWSLNNLILEPLTISFWYP
jgi:hypothetical protein